MSAIDFDTEAERRYNHHVATGGPAHGGLSVLDYFAGKAVEGLLASPRSPNTENPHENITAELIAMHAYAVAEAMLKEREKRSVPAHAVQGITGKHYG